MATVLITGGTGMIGQALTAALVKKGHNVIVLTRGNTNNNATAAVTYAQWDVAKGTIDAEALQAADYIVHLAGANVAGKRWSAERKQEIVDSRVQSGQLLCKALEENPNKVKAVISASAIGWYGADPQVPNPKPFKETDPADTAFLGATCRQWEASIQPVAEMDKRLVIFRIGIVLSNEGGAYKEFKKPLGMGVASILGKGTQVISWIHIEDLVRLIIFAMENESIQGVYNAVAPNPVSNKTLIMQMAKAKPLAIPVHVPSVALKIALGEMSIEVLKSATVSARKIESAGFTFHFPSIEQAVKNLQAQA